MQSGFPKVHSWNLLKLLSALSTVGSMRTPICCCSSMEWDLMPFCLSLDPEQIGNSSGDRNREKENSRRTLLWDLHIWLTLNRYSKAFQSKDTEFFKKPLPWISQILSFANLSLFPISTPSISHPQNTSSCGIKHQEYSLWVCSELNIKNTGEKENEVGRRMK